MRSLGSVKAWSFSATWDPLIDGDGTRGNPSEVQEAAALDLLGIAREDVTKGNVEPKGLGIDLSRHERCDPITATFVDDSLTRDRRVVAIFHNGEAEEVPEVPLPCGLEFGKEANGISEGAGIEITGETGSLDSVVKSHSTLDEDASPQLLYQSHRKSIEDEEGANTVDTLSRLDGLGANPRLECRLESEGGGIGSGRLHLSPTSRRISLTWSGWNLPSASPLSIAWRRRSGERSSSAQSRRVWTGLVRRTAPYQSSSVSSGRP